MAWREHDLYCRDLVRDTANDAYVTSLFAPAERRAALWAVHAFNHEIAKTREMVSEPMLGEIRLQWWAEAVDELYKGSPRQHQVVAALSDTVGEFRLAREPFETLIAGRRRDLAEESFANVDELFAYIGETVTPLNRLSLQALDCEDDDTLRAAEAASIAYGLSGLLRAAPYFFRQNRNFLPAEVMAECSLSERDVRSLQPSKELSKAVYRLAVLAHERLEEVASLRLPRIAFPAVLCAAQARWHLARLARVDFDPYVFALTLPIPFHEIRMALKVWSGRWM